MKGDLVDSLVQRLRAVRAAQSHARLPRRGEVAQLVEHSAENRGVAGSSPALATAASYPENKSPGRRSTHPPGLQASGPVQPCRERPLAGRLTAAARDMRVAGAAAKAAKSANPRRPSSRRSRSVGHEDRRLGAPGERDRRPRRPARSTRASSSKNGIAFMSTTRSKLAVRERQSGRVRDLEAPRPRPPRSLRLGHHRGREVDAEDVSGRVTARRAHARRRRCRCRRRATRAGAGRPVERKPERVEMVRPETRLPRRRDRVEHVAQPAAQEPPEERTAHDHVRDEARDLTLVQR